MSYLQYPGRVLGEKEKSHPRPLHFVATQLGMAPDVWMLYAGRDDTPHPRAPSALHHAELKGKICKWRKGLSQGKILHGAIRSLDNSFGTA